MILAVAVHDLANLFAVAVFVLTIPFHLARFPVLILRALVVAQQ